jgi:hypothetical protein
VGYAGRCCSPLWHGRKGHGETTAGSALVPWRRLSGTRIRQHSDLGRNAAVMVAYLLRFLVLNVLAGEYVSFDVSTTNKENIQRPQQKNPARDRLRTKGEPENGFLDEKRETSELRQSLTWNNVTYSVRLGNGETKKLIGDISGFIESGQRWH